MAAQGRGKIAWAALLALALGLGVGQVAADPDQPDRLRKQAGEPLWDPMTDDALRNDAALHDVCFVDAQNGWAVGDRGTIWHTADGGKQWVLQQSRVACRLESVSFINPQVGWAAGWNAHPYLPTGSGVLLWTQDGGTTWNHDPKLVIPALKRIRFVGPKSGWAIGSPSAMYPSGVLMTEAAGRSWTPVLGPRTPGWTAGDCLGPQVGALAGRGGITAALRPGNLQAAETPDFGLRDPTRLRLTAPNGGWLVGSGGLILRTGNQGASWHLPPGNMADRGPGQFDFAALEVRGAKCWIAGSPGTRVFHTPDAGQSWFAFPTGQTLPLDAICFTDDQNGWAVGQLGTILATQDGGQTWRRQRSGGARAALLGLFSEPEDVPLELFARLSGNEGYLAAVELLNRRDRETPPREELALADRAHEALVRVGAGGASTAWQFPLRQPGVQVTAAQAVDLWDRLHNGRGMDALEGYLVRQIRTWRPEVIVTQGAARANSPLGNLLSQAVSRAVSQAADPAAHPEQINQAGLGPWQVRRVYGTLAPGAQGDVNLTSVQLADRLGCSVGDLASRARGLVDRRFQVGPDSLGFEVLFDQSPQSDNRHDFFGGIALSPGREARRTLVDSGSETLELVRRLAQKRRGMQAIIERTTKQRQGSSLLAQAGELTRGLDPNSAGEMLYHLAQSYYRTGDWPLAAEVFGLLADGYPDHPLTRSALVWLVQYYASSEAAWREESRQRVVIRQAATFGNEEITQGNRLERVAALAMQIQQMGPDLYATPAIGFPLACAERQRQPSHPADKLLASLRTGTSRDAWWACAQGEQWIAEHRGAPPKPVLRCAMVQGKPRLDGRLDDAIWQGAQPAELHSPNRDDDAWPAMVMLACDGQFLYVGIRARQAPGARYDSAVGVRPRDADLSGRDRIELFLDLDRDFATYYHLTIDSRGWTAEDCWGDATWNPTWYVAAAQDQLEWTAEAAIPLSQLTGAAPNAKTVWALGLQRTVPGVGFQSWTAPAATEVIPEGFGYLLFE